MDPFSTAPDFILDLIFHKLNEEDLHETLRVSKSWFWASIRRVKKLKITEKYNPLKTMAKFCNNKRPTNEKMDWRELFKHLVLDELIVIGDDETTNYLVNNGCNTFELTIQSSGEEEVPVTLRSLKRVSRLQSFEFHFYWEVNRHLFLIECLKSSDIMLYPNSVVAIETIKLNLSGWNTEDPVLHSVTKLSVSHASTEFVRTMVDHCPNLEELHCTYGTITEEWRHVFPAHVKRIEFRDFNIDNDVATVINASTDSARHLLPYLCQNWESVEKFHFDGYTDLSGPTVYEAFPQEGEEVLVCPKFNEGMNLGGPLFQSREISVKCDGRKASRLQIPPTKRVKFTFDVKRNFKFSPRAVCSEPDKVEHLSLSLTYAKGFTPEPFRPRSFHGFSCLTSLTLSHVSAMTIKMALDKCPSIRKLQLKYLEASTIGKIPRGSRYANVCELVLDECKEPVTKVFKIFPCLSNFKLSAVIRNQEMREKKTDLLRRHLIGEDKKYGVVFESEAEIRFMVSGDLQASLKEAQKLLNECFQCKCFLKGFKLIRRVPKQKVCYIK